MELTSGLTFSLANHPDSRAYPPLREEVRSDVAIVGGGVSGALAAYHLVESGVDCVLVDRGPLGHGSTSASTGLLQYELDVPLRRLEGMIGERRAVRAYHACREANLKIEALTTRLDDACDFFRRRSLYLSSTTKEVKGMEREFLERQRHGFRVELLSRRDIEARYSFSRPAAILSADAAQVDAYRLSRALVRAAVGSGLRAYAGTRIVRTDRGRNGLTLFGERSARIRCKRMVLATGYEAEGYLRPGRARLVSTYAIATEPLPTLEGWHDQTLIWETARPYLYLRPGPEGRALIGGEDEDIKDPKKRDRLIGVKARRLRRRFVELFPAIQCSIAYQWAGTFAETKDGLPFIGECNEFPPGYFALGYGANGITFSLIAAEIIRDLFLGRKSPDAEIFSFRR